MALKFPEPFWRGAVGEADFFGHISSNRAERALFGVFYDFSNRSNTVTTATDSKPDDLTSEPSHILLTTVSGEALKQFQLSSDAAIVSRCVATLRKMFPGEEVPEPLSYVISRWGEDPYAMMSYSYAAVGSSGEDYDALAEEIGDTLFFAGEVSGRLTPHTLTCSVHPSQCTLLIVVLCVVSPALGQFIYLLHVQIVVVASPWNLRGFK